MPGYVIFKTIQLIRSPIKKTRQYAWTKLKEAVQRRRDGKTGLGPYDAWMYFGEILVRDSLIPVFPDNMRGLVTKDDLTVPFSELAMHLQAAGKPIEAFAWNHPRQTAYAIFKKDDGSFGFVEGLENEVLSACLKSKYEALFGVRKGAMTWDDIKTDSLEDVERFHRDGLVNDALFEKYMEQWRRTYRYSEPTRSGRNIGGKMDAINAIHDSWEAFEARLKEALPVHKRKIPLAALDWKSLDLLMDHIIPRINMYGSRQEVPKAMQLVARRFARKHEEKIRQMTPAERQAQFGKVMNEIIDEEFTRKPKWMGAVPHGTWTYDRHGWITLRWDDGMSLFMQSEADVEQFIINLGYGITDVNPGDTDDIPEHIAADYYSVATLGKGRRTGGDDSELCPKPTVDGRSLSPVQSVKDPYTLLRGRLRQAMDEQWSPSVSAGFLQEEVSSVQDDIVTMRNGMEFNITDLNLRELLEVAKSVRVNVPTFTY